MTQDHSSAERFTDDEVAFLRHVRFGELPPRVPPSDRVELTETEPPHETLPEPPEAWYAY